MKLPIHRKGESELKQLKMGVIGLGFIGDLHARVFNEMPNTKLVAVSDVDDSRLKAAANKYGCQTYKSFEVMLEEADIEAVNVCLPDQMHVKPAVAAANAGKHVLCEKPIATTAREGELIREACNEAGVRLMVAHVLRFDPRYVRMKEELASGGLGEVIHLRGKRQNPRPIVERLRGRISMLFYMGIHDIDVIQWFAQSKITKVYALKAAKVNYKFDSDDCIFILANLANGAIASFEYSWSLPANFPAGIYGGIEVVGSQGAGYVDVFEQGVRLYKETGGLPYELPDTLHWPETNGRIMGDLRDELEHFADSVLNNREFLVPTDDAIDAVRVIEAVFESLDTGNPVEVGR